MLMQHISKDRMLFVLCVAPIAVVTLFGWVLPQYVAPHLPFAIAPYYLLLDLLMAVLAPYLFCFASSMAILEEIDSNVSAYFAVTPLGKTGYMLSRLFLPAAISAVITWSILLIWALTFQSPIEALLISMFMSLSALISSMLIVSISNNKVEGMAVSKMSGLIMIGLFIPFFITENIQYIFGFLPTFWIAKFSITKDWIYIIPVVACSSIWIGVLLKGYQAKIL